MGMNKVYAIIGPPASGKSSIVKQLLNHHGIAGLVSHTTRPPHEDEREGIDYYFVDKNTFANLNLVEKVTYSGQFYGLSKEEVHNKIQSQPISVVDIDEAGLEQLEKLLRERLESIYILVDKDVILERFLLQGKNADEIRLSIEYAESQGEFNNWKIADHVVKNTGDLAAAVRQVLAIMNI